MIKGYRKLSDEEIKYVNQCKDMEYNILTNFVEGIPDLDLRWKCIAKTHFEQGFMALIRSITKPE